MLISLAHHSPIMSTPARPRRRKGSSRAHALHVGRSSGTVRTHVRHVKTAVARRETLAVSDRELAAAAPIMPPCRAWTRVHKKNGWAAAMAAATSICGRTIPCACSHGTRTHSPAHAQTEGRSHTPNAPAETAISGCWPISFRIGVRSIRSTVSGTATLKCTTRARCNHSAACSSSPLRRDSMSGASQHTAWACKQCGPREAVTHAPMACETNVVVADDRPTKTE